MQYDYALQEMHGRTQKKLGHNTYGRLNPDDPSVMIITYHATDILTINREGVCVTVDGWTTPTTKLRVNNYLPAGWRISQVHGQWEVWNTTDRKEYKFIEGMFFPWSGKPSPLSPFDDRESAKLKRRINQYAKDYINAFYSGEVERPGAGDCLYCQMQTEQGQSLGDAIKDKDHLLSHIEEKYYVPSLLYNAAKDSQSHMSIISRSVIGEWLNGNLKDDGYYRVVEDQLRRMLNKYLTTRLMN